MATETLLPPRETTLHTDVLDSRIGGIMARTAVIDDNPVIDLDPFRLPPQPTKQKEKQVEPRVEEAEVAPVARRSLKGLIQYGRQLPYLAPTLLRERAETIIERFSNGDPKTRAAAKAVVIASPFVGVGIFTILHQLYPHLGFSTPPVTPPSMHEHIEHILPHMKSPPTTPLGGQINSAPHK